MLRSLAPALMAAGLMGPSIAQLPDVLLVASASTFLTSCRFQDPVDKLVATGKFQSVDVFDALSGTPTLNQLLNYDAVLCWSNFGFANATVLGDRMADYVDAGGGVVIAAFANASPLQTHNLRGRWPFGYEVIVGQGGWISGPASLGTVLEPAHPILAGVSTFEGGSSAYRPQSVQLTPGSRVLAEWSDNAILLAEGPMANRVDLGFHPPSSDCTGGLWDPSTDGALLMAQALEYVIAGSGTVVGSRYCGPATTSSNGLSGVLDAFGSVQLTEDDLILRARDLPPQQFGYFLNSVSQGFLPGAGGSAGALCLSGAIGRHNAPGQIQSSGPLGRISLQLDLPSMPTPSGTVQIFPGETWNFQCWFRDEPSAGFSNYTNGVTVSFF